jgi:SHS2 domain-containing protein
MGISVAGNAAPLPVIMGAVAPVPAGAIWNGHTMMTSDEDRPTGRPVSGFEIVEHTADFAISGRGRDLPELFANMARGLFSLVCDLDTVRPVVRREIRIRAEPVADLLHDWLSELNGLHHLHRELYCRFQVELGGSDLYAVIEGEEAETERHSVQHEVKGVTWHELSLRETEEGFTAYVLLDV